MLNDFKRSLWADLMEVTVISRYDTVDQAAKTRKGHWELWKTGSSYKWSLWKDINPKDLPCAIELQCRCSEIDKVCSDA